MTLSALRSSLMYKNDDEMSTRSTTNTLRDFKINTKLKLSALWTAVMFCYIYGDFFSLFVPGRIKGLMNGHTGAGETTPLVLLMYAILLSIPPFMIFLSVMLKPVINRLANLAIGALFTVVMLLVVSASIDKWMIFYVYLGIIEVIITCMIIRQAWLWPKADGNQLP